MDDGAAEDLRDGDGVGDGSGGFAGVDEAGAEALPDEVVEGNGLAGCDLLLPLAIAGGGGDVALAAAENFVIGVEEFDGEPAGAAVQAVGGDGDRESVPQQRSGDGLGAGRGERRSGEREKEGAEPEERGAAEVHGGSPCG